MVAPHRSPFEDADRSAIALAAGLLLLLLGWMGATYARMPISMASHFDLTGSPDGWMRRGPFYLLFATTIVGMNLLFLAVARWAPRLGDAALNIPNKDYWLSSPERRAVAYARMARTLAWASAYMNGVFLYAYAAIVRENLGPAPYLPLRGWDLPILLGGTALFLIAVRIAAKRLFALPYEPV